MLPIHENWITIKNENIDTSLIDKLDYSPIFLQILANRNILTAVQIDVFLNPSFKDMHSPKLLPNIDIAVNRLDEALKNGEKILVFGDYDTDGIISTALIYNFLKKIGLGVDFYIPDRFEDGYDINLKFIKEKAIEEKYSLIICVDCGTNAVEVKNFILSGKSKIDIIVCDHHEPSEKAEKYKEDKDKNSKQDVLSQGLCIKNYIIVNPKLEGSSYPFKYLSGAGVVFKLIIAFVKKMGKRLGKKLPENYLTHLIDMVAVSTIADLMPLTDENRVSVKIGLKVLEHTRNKGLKTLIKKAIGRTKEINTHDIGFIIAPRINAAGRLKSAADSINLLIEEVERDEKINEKIADRLENLNIDRQRIQRLITEEIIKSYDIKELLKEQRIFICKSKEWNEGVLGIVASDIVKKFNIPVILFKESGDKLKGSGRSIDCFDLYKNLNKLRGSFIKFGGHRQACGITMELEKYESFRKDITKIANQKIKETDIVKKYFYDIEINFSDINLKLLDELCELKPHGIGNPKPLFLSRNCKIAGPVFYSQNEKHLFLKIENSGISLNAVLFNYRDCDRAENILRTAESFNILYNIEKKESFSNKNHINYRKECSKNSKKSNTDSEFQLIIQTFY